MSQTNRRQFLKTTAVGAGVAVGTGSAYADDEPQFSTSNAVKTFTATAGEGYIAIDADNPQGDGSTIGRVDFAGEQIGGDVTISGEVYADNTWESTNVDFPPIDIKNFLEEDTFDDLPIDIGLDDIDADIQVNVPTITGQYDAEQEVMTAEPFQIEVDADATVDAGITSIDLAITVSASAPLTTEQSGELEGSVQGGLDSGSANVTLVSNDFTVPATGETVSVPVIDDIDIDEQVGLPADDPSRNYLELELDMDIAEVFGFVAGTVTDDSGVGQSGIEIQVFDLEDTLVSTVTTDANGEYSIGLQPQQEPYDIVIDEERFERATASAVVEEDATTTADISLTPLDFGTVRGTVVDVDSQPISGIDVSVVNTVTGETAATVTTNETGTYEAEVLVGDIHEVSASNPDYGSDRQKVTVQSEGETKTADPLQLGERPNPATIYGGLTDIPLGADDPENGVIAVLDPVTDETIQEVTASNGSFEVDVSPGEYGIAFTADGYRDFAGTVTVSEGEVRQFNVPVEVDLPPVVGDRPPKDVDDDDTYENVRGNGEFTILDVQTLFTELESTAIQNNAWAYNFSGNDETEVTITDVQALFNKLSRR